MDKISTASYKLSTAENSIAYPSSKARIPFSLLCIKEQAALLQKLMPVNYSIVPLTKRATQVKSSFTRVNVPAIYQKIYQPRTQISDRSRRSELAQEKKQARERDEIYRIIKWTIRKLEKRMAKWSKDTLQMSSKKSNQISALLEAVKMKFQKNVYESLASFNDEVKPLYDLFPYMRINGQSIERNSTCRHSKNIKPDDKNEESADNEENLPLNPQKKSSRLIQQATEKKANKLKNNDLEAAPKPLSLLEKKNLTYKIRQLPAEHMWSLVNMIRADDEDSIPEHIDLNDLPPKTARAIQKFVESKRYETGLKNAKKKAIVNCSPKPAKGSSKLPMRVKYEEATIKDVKMKEGFLENMPSCNEIDPCAKTMGPSIKPADETESSFLSDLDDSF